MRCLPTPRHQPSTGPSQNVPRKLKLSFYNILHIIKNILFIAFVSNYLGKHEHAILEKWKNSPDNRDHTFVKCASHSVEHYNLIHHMLKHIDNA